MVYSLPKDSFLTEVLSFEDLALISSMPLLIKDEIN
jgi:hypothetical protein